MANNRMARDLEMEIAKLTQRRNALRAERSQLKAEINTKYAASLRAPDSERAAQLKLIADLGTQKDDLAVECRKTENALREHREALTRISAGNPTAYDLQLAEQAGKEKRNALAKRLVTGFEEYKRRDALKAKQRKESNEAVSQAEAILQKLKQDRDTKTESESRQHISDSTDQSL